MKRTLVVLVIVAACSGEDPTSAPTRRLADLTGRWVFQMQSRAGQCQGAAGGGPLYVDLTADPYSPSETGLVNFVDSWDVENRSPLRFTLIGSARVAEGEIDFRLWKAVLSAGSELVGTLDAQNNFTGTLADPIPGYSANFVLGSCVFPVTGARVSP